MSEMVLPEWRIVRVKCAGDHKPLEVFPRDKRAVFDDREWTFGPWISNLFVVWFDPKDEPLETTDNLGALPVALLFKFKGKPLPAKLRHVEWARTDDEGFLCDDVGQAVRWPVNAGYKVYLVRHPDLEWVKREVYERLQACEDVPGGIQLDGGASSDGKAKLAVGKGGLPKWEPGNPKRRPVRVSSPDGQVGVHRKEDDESLMLELAEESSLFLPQTNDWYDNWTLYRGMPHAQCKAVRKQVLKLQYHLGHLRYIVGCQNSPYLPEQHERIFSLDTHFPNVGHFDVMLWNAVFMFQEDARQSNALELADFEEGNARSGPPPLSKFFELGTGERLIPPPAPPKPALFLKDKVVVQSGDPAKMEGFEAPKPKPAASLKKAAEAEVDRMQQSYIHEQARISKSFLNAEPPATKPARLEGHTNTVFDKSTADALKLWLISRYRKPDSVLVVADGMNSWDWVNQKIVAALEEWARRLKFLGFSAGVQANHTYRDIRHGINPGQIGGSGAVIRSAHKVGLAMDFRQSNFRAGFGEYPLVYTVEDVSSGPSKYDPLPGLRYRWEVFAPIDTKAKVPGYERYYRDVLRNVFGTAGEGGKGVGETQYSDTSMDAGKPIPSYSKLGASFVSLTEVAHRLHLVDAPTNKGDESVAEKPSGLPPMFRINSHGYGAQGGKNKESISLSDAEYRRFMTRMSIHNNAGHFSKERSKRFEVIDPSPSGSTKAVDGHVLKADYEAWMALTWLSTDKTWVSKSTDLKVIVARADLYGHCTFRVEDGPVVLEVPFAELPEVVLRVEAREKAKLSPYKVTLVGTHLKPGFKVEFPEIQGDPSHLEWWHYQGGFSSGLDLWPNLALQLGLPSTLTLGRPHSVDKFGFGGLGYSLDDAMGVIY